MRVLDTEREEGNFTHEASESEEEPENFAAVVGVGLYSCVFVLTNGDLVGGVVEGRDILAEEWVSKDDDVGVHV